jgi:NUDIX domain
MCVYVYVCVCVHILFITIRANVPDNCVSWTTAFASYNPPEFTEASILAQKVSVMDGPDPKCIDGLSARLTYETDGKIQISAESGAPINPRGRTGLRGRGILWLWGPNMAADPIVTRCNPDTKKLEMVAIKRHDTGDWAIPGGMVDPGEHVSATLKREFIEEAGNVSADDVKKQEDIISRVFDESNAVLVYNGMSLFFVACWYGNSCSRAYHCYYYHY